MEMKIKKPQEVLIIYHRPSMTLFSSYFYRIFTYFLQVVIEFIFTISLIIL